jgi:hypothetical protein
MFTFAVIDIMLFIASFVQGRRFSGVVRFDELVLPSVAVDIINLF